MSRRENLSFQYYDKNFNFNSDRYCCSRNNQRMLGNVYSQLPPICVSKDYSANLNYTDKDMATPLYVKKVFGDSDNNYTFNVQGYQFIPCSRMPGGIYFNTLPCADKRTATINPGCCQPAHVTYNNRYNLTYQ